MTGYALRSMMLTFAFIVAMFSVSQVYASANAGKMKKFNTEQGCMSCHQRSLSESEKSFKKIQKVQNAVRQPKSIKVN